MHQPSFEEINIADAHLTSDSPITEEELAAARKSTENIGLGRTVEHRSIITGEFQEALTVFEEQRQHHPLSTFLFSWQRQFVQRYSNIERIPTIGTQEQGEDVVQYEYTDLQANLLRQQEIFTKLQEVATTIESNPSEHAALLDFIRSLVLFVQRLPDTIDFSKIASTISRIFGYQFFNNTEYDILISTVTDNSVELMVKKSNEDALNIFDTVPNTTHPFSRFWERTFIKPARGGHIIKVIENPKAIEVNVQKKQQLLDSIDQIKTVLTTPELLVQMINSLHIFIANLPDDIDFTKLQTYISARLSFFVLSRPQIPNEMGVITAEPIESSSNLLSASIYQDPRVVLRVKDAFSLLPRDLDIAQWQAPLRQVIGSIGDFGEQDPIKMLAGQLNLERRFVDRLTTTDLADYIVPKNIEQNEYRKRLVLLDIIVDQVLTNPALQLNVMAIDSIVHAGSGHFSDSFKISYIEKASGEVRSILIKVQHYDQLLDNDITNYGNYQRLMKENQILFGEEATAAFAAVETTIYGKIAQVSVARYITQPPGQLGTLNPDEEREYNINVVPQDAWRQLGTNYLRILLAGTTEDIQGPPSGTALNSKSPWRFDGVNFIKIDDSLGPSIENPLVMLPGGTYALHEDVNGHYSPRDEIIIVVEMKTGKEPQRIESTTVASILNILLNNFDSLPTPTLTNNHQEIIGEYKRVIDGNVRATRIKDDCFPHTGRTLVSLIYALKLAGITDIKPLIREQIQYLEGKYREQDAQKS